MSEQSTITVTTVVNGKRVVSEVRPLETLAEFLRYRLNLTGTHLGCEVGGCGACTVLINGKAARACLTLAAQVAGAEIITVEGLSDGLEASHPLQKAFIKYTAMQCGFCTPGVLMTMVDFLGTNAQPTRDEIRQALDSNICRCGSYQNIVDAVFETSRGIE